MKTPTYPRGLLAAAACAALLAAGCGGGVEVGVGWYSGPDYPWPNHPDWPSWPDRPKDATGLYPVAGDVCGVCNGSRDGTGAQARFHAPEGLAADKAGNLYVAEPASSAVRKVTPQGVATTVAGASAGLSRPNRLTLDGNGNLYTTDGGHSTVIRIGPDGTTATLAGNGSCGSANGVGSNAQFCNPKGIVLDKRGNLWVADTGNHTVRRIDPKGNVTTVAGTQGVCGSKDGRGNVAQFCNPQDVQVDQWDNVYVVDTGNSTIRMINPKGEVSTLAGQAGQCGAVDGSPTMSRLCAPSGIAIEGNDLYIADTGNATIRRINLDNVTSTVAGVAGKQSITLGPLPGSLDHPIGIVRAPDGSFALTTHNLVAKLVPAK